MLNNKLRNINIGNSLSSRIIPTGSKLPPIVIATASLANGAVGVAYSQTLVATGGVGSLTWTLESGSLPNGLSLSTAGVISGTCSHGAVYSFVVKVTDTVSQTKTVSLSITVPIVVIPDSALAAIDLGWASPTAIWTCDESSGNLVDKIGSRILTPNATTSLNQTFPTLYSKKCIKSAPSGAHAGYAVAANGTILDVAAVSFTISYLFSTSSLDNATIFCILGAKYNAYGSRGFWVYYYSGQLTFRLTDAGGDTWYNIPFNLYDNSVHLFTAHRDLSTNKVRLYLDKQATSEQNCARTGSLTTTNAFSLLNDTSEYYHAHHTSLAWHLINIGVADSRTGHDAMCDALGIT